MLFISLSFNEKSDKVVNTVDKTYGICWLKAIMFTITYDIQLFYINRALKVVRNVPPNNIVGMEPLEHSIGGAATNEHCDITLE